MKFLALLLSLAFLTTTLPAFGNTAETRQKIKKEQKKKNRKKKAKTKKPKKTELPVINEGKALPENPPNTAPYPDPAKDTDLPPPEPPPDAFGGDEQPDIAPPPEDTNLPGDDNSPADDKLIED